MTKLKYTILLLLGFTFIYSGCKKDEPEDCSPGCTQDTSFENVLDWCYFEVGTWWLYQEETTLEKDCVYVWSAEMTLEPAYFENKMYTTHGDFDLYYFFLPDYTGQSNVSECRLRRIRRGKINPPFFIGSGYIANIPVIEGEFSSDGSGMIGGSLTTELDSSYTWNGMDFGLTAIFNVGVAGSEEWQSAVYSISKNIGLVRREVPDEDEIWNLVEYNIIQ